MHVYPTSKNKITKFGLENIANATLVNHYCYPEELGKKETTIIILLLDKYYFTSAKYEEDGDLDDFYGSIANCSIRFTAKGPMEYKGINNIELTITKIGIYVRDGFDYVGNQPLGYWSLKNKKVSTNILLGDSRSINNESYRDYRKDSGMGQDFYRYSNMYMYDTNFKFKL